MKLNFPGRRELSDPVGSYGRKVTEGPSPERVEAARARELEMARRIAPEAPFSDFDVIQSGPGRWLFVDRATGQQFRRVESYDLLNDFDSVSVARQNIACFTIDAGGQLHFLRRRGVGVSPSSLVYHGKVIGMEIPSPWGPPPVQVY